MTFENDTTTIDGTEKQTSRPSPLLEKARDFRYQGNHLFRQQQEYQGALHFYNQAIETLENADIDATTANERDTIIKEEALLNYCNRSACYLVMEDAETAKKDALYAWETLSNKTSVKAAFRLAKAFVALQEDANAKDLIRLVLPSTTTTTEDSSAAADVTSQFTLTEDEVKSFQELWSQVLQSKLVDSNDNNHNNDGTEKSIKFVQRPVSIREFVQQKELGYGNFSEIRIVTHRVTNEQFALKKIPKKQAADLAKRQHPNVYNEIQMERRVLLERLNSTDNNKRCPFVIQMYHAFQDYEHLYYLMELHHTGSNNDHGNDGSPKSSSWNDLWSELRWKSDPAYMVGCHRSHAKLWLYQLILALEHLHRHGIVHRDIKAENILLNKRGHLVLIDFGTAKDLIMEDLNGPEFVGTPDFMPPEAVTGDASTGPVPLDKAKSESKKFGEATWCADLWALGALGYILQTGMTPFWTTSPYLAFLRIQRGLLTRPTGILDDDCWDWISRLLKIQPKERFGAQAFEKKKMIIVERDPGRGYVELKEHPYLADIHAQYTGSAKFRHKTPIPSLRDLCYRAVADMAYADCQDLDLCEAHPPGDGSPHDLTRLEGRDRKAVLHLLDRQKLLGKETRLWNRFFKDSSEARLEAKIRPATRDVVGLTQMNDDQGKAPQAAVEQAQFGGGDKKKDELEMLQFVQICSPLLMGEQQQTQQDVPAVADEEEAATLKKKQVKLFRKCIARINKVRPKLVVVSSNVPVDDACRKLLARINESIPVVMHQPSLNNDHEVFCSFWLSGIQGMCLSHSLAVDKKETSIQKQQQQVDWVREQVDLVRMSKHPLFCFVNGPVHSGDFPLHLLKKLARGHTLCVFGPAATLAEHSGTMKKQPGMKVKYHANERLPKSATWSGQEEQDIDMEQEAGVSSMNKGSNDDDVSVKSTDSIEDSGDEFTMLIDSTSSDETGLRWITVDPIHADEWSHSMEWVNLDK
mmetsp:Transcript_4872/g.6319  ORF Transcript_4872/g.6319 Transcript_4872/m.6319 type:complete len:978 (+) Transcript_4872:207-3140(+)|eukprot:CAMPEP_0198151410 /NCGR_PEP_ID=MMETSP1443-20131203/55529_1 /TAXON_ID=186043 /ORGANISM="Entomoneis sp., Strain CCMP2396" /LENGTH=977 /DNA_ID=CAMNT_0043817057 /DNA_START=143 /DNA_END=3076 /DNA_ORIENTATION=-